MIKEVLFQGLSHSPSDHESQEGELGTCLNLINEDGALHPIHQPAVIDESKNITLPLTSSINLVHKVTHDGKTHSHYIIRDSSNEKWYWIESNASSSSLNEFVFGNGFVVNSVCAMGNILCFVGSNSTKYAFWRNGFYVVLSRETMQYNLTITNTYTQKETVKAEIPDEFWSCFVYDSNVSEDKRVLEKTSATGTRKMFTAIDAIVNKRLSEQGNEYFKRNVIGVAALRLYDGSYINISNLFVLPHNEVPAVHDNVLSNRINCYINANKIQAPNGKTVVSSITFNKFNINISNTQAMEGIKELVQGIDIFLTNGESFLQLDKQYSVSQSSFDNTWDGYITLDNLEGKELYDYIGNLSFFHSIFIPFEDFGQAVALKRPIGTEETLSLAELNNQDFGGETSITYNNRLHIAGIKKNINSSLVMQCTNNSSIQKFCIFEIQTKDNGTYYLQSSISTEAYIVSVPFTNVEYITVYTTSNKWKLKTYSPSSFGLSLYVYNNKGNLNQVLINATSITSTEWDAINQKAADFAKNYSDSNNNSSLIKVSEAENPMVFPAKNSVQVGSSIINALAANTRPISEGQFGEAPLYAFTDEGVWVLMTNQEGTYDARQPANRDICSNPKGILQIDDAVLFPTERGIMMQRGRDSECITDVLDGYPFVFTQIFKNDYQKKLLALGGISESDTQYIRFRTFLKKASLIYDYYDNRIIVFRPDYTYAYVYSLKSRMWGTMHNVFRSTVNSYPESYAINQSGKIVDVYVKEPSGSVSYFFCTRPLTLGQENIHKTIFKSIIRGYFRNAAKGKVGVVLYGSNDLFNWFYIHSSVNQLLAGMAGSPYKYFRFAVMGSLSYDESIHSVGTEFVVRLQNKLR